MARIHELTPRLYVPDAVRCRRGLPSWPCELALVRVAPVRPARYVLRVGGLPELWLAGTSRPRWWSALAECDVCDRRTRWLYLTEPVAWRCRTCAGVATARRTATLGLGAPLRRARRLARGGRTDELRVLAGEPTLDGLAAMAVLVPGLLPAAVRGVPPARRRRRRRRTAEEAVVGWLETGWRTERWLLASLRRSGCGGLEGGGDPVWLGALLVRRQREGLVEREGSRWRAVGVRRTG